MHPSYGFSCVSSYFARFSVAVLLADIMNLDGQLVLCVLILAYSFAGFGLPATIQFRHPKNTFPFPSSCPFAEFCKFEMLLSTSSELNVLGSETYCKLFSAYFPLKSTTKHEPLSCTLITSGFFHLCSTYSYNAMVICYIYIYIVKS